MPVRLAAVAAAAAVVVASLSCWSAPAGAATLFDQGGVNPADVRNLSTAVLADDFELTSGAATLRSVQAYLVDSALNDNGLLDSLNGTLSWALYDGGFVDADTNLPDDLIATGSVTGADLVLTDTGLDTFGGDIIRAHFNITPPQPLDANNVYWIALHEGAWLSDGDDTPVGWVRSTGLFETESVRDLVETNPGDGWQTNEYDLAFALFDTAVPEPTAGAAVAAAVLAFAGLARRRVRRRFSRWQTIAREA